MWFLGERSLKYPATGLSRRPRRLRADDVLLRGVGRRLLAFAEERIFRESPNVFLCVSSFNAGARRLYLRLGYELIGELKDYIVRGHSELLMRKTRGPLREFQRP